MKIEINVEEAIMLSAMKKMRSAVKSTLSKKQKITAINAVFWECMRELDQKGMDINE